MSLFGQNNNQQQSSGFGGFGSSNTGGGFGQSSNTGSGFGGGASSTSGFGGFGSGGSGFGSNNNATTNNSLFGQQNKPAFGSSSGGGGLFGSTPTTSSGGFGGFGAGTTNNNTSGGIFGSGSKPAFGGGTSGGSLFGGTNTNANSTFGSPNNQQSNSFGSPFGQNNAVCEGTGSTPFQPFTEKEGTSSVTNHFQSVSFMAPYKNWSFEELRLADYNQGRRFGNGSGQAGAFGSTNFGGFGQQQQQQQQQQNNTGTGFGQQTNANSGGLFGSNTATSSPFGNNQSTGFGANNTSGGLFGQQQQQSKPGGLFGATTSSTNTGGLFGTTNNTTSTPFGTSNQSSGFGSNNNNSTGGLFGQSNNQQQSKPFSFGASSTGTGGAGFGSNSTGFGSNAASNTGGGLFGNQNSNNAFGQQNNSQSSNPFGGFGQQNQNQNQSQNNTSNAFGGGFGQQNQDQKPGGLFGNSSNTNAAGGGLFGNQNNNQSGGGLFGQSNNNQSNTGSLFDSKSNGGGLFGSANTNPTNTGGLFGSNQNQNQTQQNQGGGLFGNLNNQQKPGGLFGSTNNNAGGTTNSLFGNNTNTANNNQPAGNNPFSFGTQNNQQQQQSTGGSLFGGSSNNASGSGLFGNSQQQPTQQNQFQPAQTLQTSIMDPNAFGSPSIFSGLPPPPQVSGPIATPISQKSKQKKNALLPYYKLTPNRASTLQTPSRGYGFSYSTYGSPSSVSSIGSTPGGFSSSLLSGSVSRSLGKSLSTSNLRSNYRSPESILTPGAFSAGGSRYGGQGSMKKLTIDRSLRTDLFGDRGAPGMLTSPEKDRQPQSLKKRVSFDANTVGGNGGHQMETSTVNGQAGAEDDSSPTPSAREQGLLRSQQLARPKKSSSLNQVEHESLQGNELAIVPEDGSPDSIDAPPKRLALPHSQEDQPIGQYWMKPAKEQIQKMSREERSHLSNFSVGRQGCGKVEFNRPVDLSIHKLDDIYEDVVRIRIRTITVYPDTLKKPPQGQGLNVPATIYLENSWPRQRDKKTLVYEKSGPRFNKHVERLKHLAGTSFVDYQKDSGTWIFTVPHFTTYGFDYEDDDSEGESLHLSNSVLTEPPDTPTPIARAVSSKAEDGTLEIAEYASATPEINAHNSHVESRRPSRKRAVVPGSFDEDFGAPGYPTSDQEMIEIEEPPPLSPTASSDEEVPDVDGDSESTNDDNKSFQDSVIDHEVEMAGAFPEIVEDQPKAIVNGLSSGFSNNWTETLLKSVSSGLRDRQVFRREEATIPAITPSDQRNEPQPKTGLLTSIDLMNSLFGQSKGSAHLTRSKGGRDGSKKSTIAKSNDDQPASDTLPESASQWNSLIHETKSSHPAKFTHRSPLITNNLTMQRNKTEVRSKDSIPSASLRQTSFRDFHLAVEPDSDFENLTWELSSILFDDQEKVLRGIPDAEKGRYEARVRKDRLIAFWQRICKADADRAAHNAKNEEERATAYLTANNKEAACEALGRAKDFRLMTLVSQIGGNQDFQQQIGSQIDAWRELNVLSEMSEPIRAVYSLLAGNTCICEGKRAPHIEDRAPNFAISDRFKLDWKRAFNLRLCYAIQTSDPIEVAVETFLRDCEGDEPAKPGDDIMFSLLKLYAANKLSQALPSLDSLLLPKTETSSALTARLSFQLYFVLKALFPPLSSAAADTAVKLFAVQLDSAGEWLWAIFALLHISDPKERQSQLEAILSHHAKDIPADPPYTSNKTWQTLTQEFQIPEATIWQAKAFHARAAEHDRVREAAYLVKAKRWKEAHEVLSRVVGPECVIAEEWAQLQGLLQAFKPGRAHIEGWGLGGQVYTDYLSVIMDLVDGKQKAKTLKTLLESLRVLARDALKKVEADEEDRPAFLERVAVEEMSAVVAKEVNALKEEGIEIADKLLPLVQDGTYLKETAAMNERFHSALKH